MDQEYTLALRVIKGKVASVDPGGVRQSDGGSRPDFSPLRTKGIIHGAAMIVYHVTKPEYADAIERNGFKDNTAAFMSNNIYTGVWVSDWPITADVPWEEPVTFEIDIADALLAGHEWIEEGSNHREWLVPAVDINTCRLRRVEWPECLDEIETRRGRGNGGN